MQVVSARCKYHPIRPLMKKWLNGRVLSSKNIRYCPRVLHDLLILYLRNSDFGCIHYLELKKKKTQNVIIYLCILLMQSIYWFWISSGQSLQHLVTLKYLYIVPMKDGRAKNKLVKGMWYWLLLLLVSFLCFYLSFL